MSEEYEKSWEFLVGDAKERLQDLPEKSVQTCVTSPPYWALRDYEVDGQLGLEDTPGEYVSNLCDVFDEVWSVLRDDGTLWLNLGDTYAANRTQNFPDQKHDNHDYGDSHTMEVPSNLKPKDLIGIPWRVAFELQRRGWYLRNDIIWHKPNAMPNSVTDRCTNAHEHVFLLSKSDQYFFDHEAIKEPIKKSTKKRRTRHKSSGSNPNRNDKGGLAVSNGSRRNKRDVWSISTKPFSEAHFAVYSPDLIRPCIKAGTSEKECCPECGSPWKRVMEDTEVEDLSHKGSSFHDGKTARHQKDRSSKKTRTLKRTAGWESTCECGSDKEPVPCTVLDPFAGAGTTNLVADRLGRKSIGIELNPKYVEMAEDRLKEDRRERHPPHDDRYVPRESENELPDEVEFDELLGGDSSDDSS